MSESAKKLIAQTFMDMANALETGTMGHRPVIALTGMGSEHGESVTLAGAEAAAAKGVDVIYIGTLTSDKVRTVSAACEADAHEKMEQLLSSGSIDGAVTMHYPFPIGVSTVGRVVTPARGKSMYIATTTGTSSTDRIEGMIRNAVYGIIAAKACGNPNPTVGIANLDGARQTEAALKKLAENGYPITFAQSGRADGGCVMRGNDILTGAADVMVTDTLTGNLLIKMLSAFQSGGSYESVGWGYGPGIGEGYDRLVMIVSRASGSAVIAGAIEYAAELVRGGWNAVAKAEFEAAVKAGLHTVYAPRKAEAQAEEEEVKAPAKEVVTAAIPGIEVMDLEDAVKALWKQGIYAESGMGCTGPIVLVPEAKAAEARQALVAAGYLG